MPIYQLEQNDTWFPTREEYEGDIVAVGGDLLPERLLTAYHMGIFPWYNDPGEIMWWCPEERCVLLNDEVRISHSMRNVFNARKFEIRMDTCFDRVMEECRARDRKDHTWILDEIKSAYLNLHEAGLAHSVEVWQGKELVGGLYGVSLGHVFFGESMFSIAPNSSKFAFISLARILNEMGWKLMDCQVPTEHLMSLGARSMERNDFLNLLEEELKHPTLLGPWTELPMQFKNIS
jgi:leucyl/phenylalanyl-tRNA--protein transferase